MVVQVQAISQRDTTDLEARFKERAAQLRARAAERIVDAIIDGSPVDTGTYVMAHAAGVGAVPEIASRSSHGKTRGRSAAQFKALARHNLKRSVSAAAVQAGSEIWFRNRAFHAAYVEHIGWKTTPAYHVYSNAAHQAPQFILDAAREMGMTAR